MCVIVHVNLFKMFLFSPSLNETYTSKTKLIMVSNLKDCPADIYYCHKVKFHCFAKAAAV